MTFPKAISIRIRELCENRNLNLTEFRSACKLPDSAVDMLLSGDNDYDVEYVFAACKVLQIPIAEFFNIAPFNITGYKFDDSNE